MSSADTPPSLSPPLQPAGSRPISGIGGWLVLPMLGMISTPVVQVISLIQSSELQVNFAGLPAGQQALIWIEEFAQVVLFIAAPILLLTLFFRKLRRFPGGYVIWTIAAAVYLVVDLIAGYVTFREVYDSGTVELFDSATIRAFISAAAGLCIWVPYMRMSQRVKNTFVN